MSPNPALKSKKFVAVSEFLAAAQQELGLELVAGEAGLERNIEEPAVNRPGLGLTGFFQYFAHRRIQVMGHAEHAYLASLPEKEREPRLRCMFEKQIPCVVVTRTRKASPILCALADEFSAPLMRCPLITGHFVNAATLIMEELQLPEATMQGTMVEIMGIGVMIMGQSGIGKSETALALVKRGHSLVADDVTSVRRDSTGVVMGTALTSTRFHMEIRGLGIIHVPSLFGVASVRESKRLDLVVNMEKAEEGKDPRDMFSSSHVGTTDVLGVEIPRIVIPIAPGRDIAGLVEVAALDQKLKRLGHDAAKELDEKLIQSMATGDSGRE